MVGIFCSDACAFQLLQLLSLFLLTHLSFQKQLAQETQNNLVILQSQISSLDKSYSPLQSAQPLTVVDIIYCSNHKCSLLKAVGLEGGELLFMCVLVCALPCWGRVGVWGGVGVCDSAA